MSDFLTNCQEEIVLKMRRLFKFIYESIFEDIYIVPWDTKFWYQLSQFFLQILISSLIACRSNLYSLHCVYRTWIYSTRVRIWIRYYLNIYTSWLKSGTHCLNNLEEKSYWFFLFLSLKKLVKMSKICYIYK